MPDGHHGTVCVVDVTLNALHPLGFEAGPQYLREVHERVRTAECVVHFHSPLLRNVPGAASMCICDGIPCTSWRME